VALTLGLLVWQRLRLHERLDPEARRVLERKVFRAMHREYL
jgi:hypothetical protein